MSANPQTLTLGQSATLSWTSTRATSCTASGAWSGSQAVSGTATVTPNAVGTNTYTLTCTGPGGTVDASATVTATARPPQVSFSVNPPRIPLGQSATLTWSVTDADSCQASDAWTGTQPLSGSLVVTPAAIGNFTYTLTCTGTGGATSVHLTLTVNPAPAHFTSGNQAVVAGPQVIGPNGGTLTVPEGGALAGVVVTFPPGALSEEKTVTILSDDGSLTTNDGTPGQALVLDLGGPVDFALPVQISIPYEGDVLPIPYSVDPLGNLHVAQLAVLDRVNHIAVFDTFHESLFTWITTTLGWTDPGYFPTYFAFASDAFQIDNRGPLYSRPGEAFGISSFALSYFEDVTTQEGAFYPRFMDQIGVDSEGRTMVGQHIIATRAFLSFAQLWTTYYPSLLQGELRLTAEENYAVIRNALLNTQNPVLIYLAQTGTAASHSVLALGYEGGEILVYDPNVHDESFALIYDLNNKVFNPYTSGSTSYDRVGYSGDGSLRLRQPYLRLLEDAKQNFQGSDDATLTVTSHHSGDSVTSRVVTLEGTVDSPQVPVTKIAVFVGSTQYQANVDSEGAFSIAVSVESGVNHLQFMTQGTQDGALTEVPNTLRTQDFTLVGTFPASVIVTTLTWDTDNTDLDTYVIDPTGDYSCYFHPTTADGGVLDFDETGGYGPEHWTLNADNTIRWNQDYHMRVHYYDDNGAGPSNYTVSVRLYDGDQAITSYYRGNLAVSNSSNDDPNDTGPDWADVATITPVQLTGSAGATGRIVFDSKPGAPLHITVYVPPRAARVKR